MRVLRQILKSLLQLVAVFVVIGVVGAGWRFYRAAQINDKVHSMAERIRVGMTVPEFVAVFPEGYFNASVSSLKRTAPCRTAAGNILPPEDSADKLETMTAEAPAPAAVVVAPCPPVSFIKLSPDSGQGTLRIELHSHDVPESKFVTITREEFANLLQNEFQGRGCYVGFGFEDGLPHHISFGVDFGPDGRVSGVLKPFAWD